MRGTLTFIAAAIITTQTCFGQTPAAPAKPAAEVPSVDQILARCIEAEGGKAAMEKLTTRIIEGTLELPMLPAPAALEVRAQTPDKVWVKTDIQGMGESVEACDGQVAWAKNPATGVAEKKDDELAKSRRDAAFSNLMLKATYPDLKFKEIKKVGEADAYVLESKPTSVDHELFYFDVKSGLFVEKDSDFQVRGTNVKTVTRLEDYRSVDGIKEPFTVHVQITVPNQPEISMTIKCKSVKHNAPVDVAIFKKPTS